MVEIVESLFEEIEKRFKQESSKIFDLMESVEKNPRKGKLVGVVGGIVIKELKYKGFRFYFLTEGHKLKFLNGSELTELLLRFVRMSDKKHQKAVIKEIKKVLREIGPDGF